MTDHKSYIEEQPEAIFDRAPPNKMSGFTSVCQMQPVIQLFSGNCIYFCTSVKSFLKYV
jgi:hypothetical protein